MLLCARAKVRRHASARKEKIVACRFLGSGSGSAFFLRLEKKAMELHLR